MKSMVPPGVVVAEAFGDPLNATLFPGEEAAVASAVEKRRREYTTVRHCARLAMVELGLPPTAVLSGEKREPLWPAGVVGSMTHCDGYRAAALARASTVASLGIDAEPNLPLPDGVLEAVAEPEECKHLRECMRQRPDVHWDRALFSAKESVYKAWFPLARSWLGFEDASIRFDVDAGTFAAELFKPGPPVAGTPLRAMRGRWRVRQGLVMTAITV